MFLAEAQARVTRRRGYLPANFYFCNSRTEMADKELSVFVDESGSFDSSVIPSRFYVVSLVFHDQRHDISQNLSELATQLGYLNLADVCIHAGPLIRREEQFRLMDIHLRRQLFFRLLAFVLHAPICHHSFVVDKRYFSSPSAIAKSLSTQMSTFLVQSSQRLADYDMIKIYYDNGQAQVRRILEVAFADLPATFVENVTPIRYRLFQAADLVCTVELLKAKRREAIAFTKSEEMFFPSLRDLKKNVIRPLVRLEI